MTGTITNFRRKKGEVLPELTLAVPIPGTAEMGIFKTQLSEDGSFQFEVPVECSINVGMIGSELFPADAVCIGLISGEVTKLEISFEETGKIKANMDGLTRLLDNKSFNPLVFSGTT